MSKPNGELECVDIKLEKILISITFNDSSFALLSSKTKNFCIALNSIEGTMLSYVKSGCFLKSNIDTIYHMYLKTMSGMGFELKSAVIELQKGDIFFARLYWTSDKRKKEIVNVCGAGDAIVLSLMTEAPLKIIKKVLEEIEEFESDPEFFETDEFQE